MKMELASLFTNGMVLQQKKPIRIFGYGAGTVKVSFMKVKVSAKFQDTDLDEDGRWVLELPPKEAGGPYTMTVWLNREKHVLTDVMIGEVFVCAGQSNMEVPLMQSTGGYTEGDGAYDDDLRIFELPQLYHKEKPVMTKQGGVFDSLGEVDTPWQRCTPDVALKFSAIGYYFGKLLRRRLGVAVGLIGCYWGGKNLQTFIPVSEYLKYPKIAAVAQNYLKSTEGLDMEKYTAEYVDFVKIIGKYCEFGGHAPIDFFREHGPTAPIAAMTHSKWPESMMGGPYNSSRPGCLWETMVSRLIPYAVQGVLWYQGETNSNDYPDRYFDMFEALLSSWRRGFRDQELPFYTVELCPYGQIGKEKNTYDGWARVREQQQRCVKNYKETYIVPTSDCGEEFNIHPCNKVTVAERLFRSVLKHTYHCNVVGDGAMLQDWRVEENKMILTFSGVTEFQPNGCPREFYICGADKVFHWAFAVLKDNTITLTSENVPEPVAARYDFWKTYRPGDVKNEAGWPLHPFRTDDFSDATFAD